VWGATPIGGRQLGACGWLTPAPEARGGCERGKSPTGREVRAQSGSTACSMFAAVGVGPPRRNRGVRHDPEADALSKSLESRRDLRFGYQADPWRLQPPSNDGLRREPDGDISAPYETPLVLAPVAHAVPRLVTWGGRESSSAESDDPGRTPCDRSWEAPHGCRAMEPCTNARSRPPSRRPGPRRESWSPAAGSAWGRGIGHPPRMLGLRVGSPGAFPDEEVQQPLYTDEHDARALQTPETDP